MQASEFCVLSTTFFSLSHTNRFLFTVFLDAAQRLNPSNKQHTLGPFAPTWRMHTTFVTTAPFWRGRVACISTRTTPFPLHISSVNSCFSVAASPPPKESDPLGAYSSSGLVRDTGKTRDSRSGTGCLTLLQPSRYPLLEVNSSAGSGTSNDI